MLQIKPLGLSAKQWQFLSAPPDRYVEEHSGRKLVLESTRRQFLTARDILARLNGSCGETMRRGILLADDVGLGKTTVAALVAWVVASAGKKVRILAPNDVMMRRWAEELKAHISPLQKCAPGLNVKKNCVKEGRVKLHPGSIQVVKHSYAASEWNIECDLLIIDEAHRAKGEKTAFSMALKKKKKDAERILILTATPFSIQIDELERMLKLIGGEADGPVKSFKKALDKLYAGNAASPDQVEGMAKRLAEKAKNAVEALGPFVIRHSIDDLPEEQSAFGRGQDWPIEVPPASLEEIELGLRMDRALRIAKDEGIKLSQATNDPRFHVGWRHFDEIWGKLKDEANGLAEPAKAIVENHLKSIRDLRKRVGVHAKMAAVGKAVVSTVERGEKVLLFCHHHATAQELTVHLDSVLPAAGVPKLPRAVWMRAWKEVLDSPEHDYHREEMLDTFARWLCSDLIRAQTGSWLPPTTSESTLVEELKKTKCRLTKNPEAETIGEAAGRLYRTLIDSNSSRAVLKEAGGDLKWLPGANGGSRVLGVCKQPSDKEESLFLHNTQPDTVIAIFNSPFGPDVLVVTDKLSEGIDLHRYCRHLIHYELDPSPVRTVQRNGRVRRVNSWAAVTAQPILYAYPAFRGTRDYRLVQIMKKRIDSFSLLLGGVQEIEIDAIINTDEKWRNDVIAAAKKSLEKSEGKLCAKEPGAT